MIDWAGGYSTEWRVFEVDPETWADGDEVSGLSGLQVSRDSNLPTVERGSATLDVPMGTPMEERYLRFAMTAVSGTSVERVDVATMLCSSGSGTLDKGLDMRSLSGESVLYPASVCRITPYTYAPAGTDGAEYAAAMLRSCIKAPVAVVGEGFTLDSYMAFEPDDDLLARVLALLGAGGYGPRISGRGVVTLAPRDTRPSLDLREASARMLSPQRSYRFDLREVKNRWRTVSGTAYADAVNDDPNSPTSYATRGYWVDEVERSPKLVNGETLRAHAERMLAEQRVVTVSTSYKRRYWPDVYPGSIVAATRDTVGVDGWLTVTKQGITCGTDIDVSEEAGMEVTV